MRRLFFLLGVIFCTLSSCSQQKNIAYKKPVFVSSEKKEFPASNIVDGKVSRTSKWEAASNQAPHIVEIDLQKYFTINEIRVHSGIMDKEKKADEMNQAAGFWSVKNFRLQYWDDANWSDFTSSEVLENRLTTAVFKYDPGVSTFKIRLISDDGEAINIMEMEAFGEETPGMPAPPTLESSVIQSSENRTPQNVTVTVSSKQTGKSMKYVGYNQGYYLPGSNVSGWVEYSNVNSFRVWTSLNAFVPASAVQTAQPPVNLQQFDDRKAKLRQNPEDNSYIKWDSLYPLYDKSDTSSTNSMVFNYALAELKRLKIDVVLQIGSTDFNDTWENKWKQWQRYYAIAYYAAKKGDVSMFAMQNEPNHRHSGPMKLDQWIIGMQIVSDAIHCAVDDVNKKYGKFLNAKFVGPVTAGQNTEWWATVAKNIRNGYNGNRTEKDLLQIFSTHSYNSPAVGYASRISGIQKLITENHPVGDSLPIVYTEIGRWMNAYLIDKEETMDSPSLFTEWAGIYSNNMKNGGYGMWAFKFANTTSGAYPRGIKSGHHYIWQGKRIVEDAYENLAYKKAVSGSTEDLVEMITDGNKGDNSTWVADSTQQEKWIEIDLGKQTNLGSAVIYTGSASGVYTAPDRIKNFELKYLEGNSWKVLPGTVENNNKYAQVFTVFDKPVSTSKIRFVSSDEGALKIREIKLFAPGDGPSEEKNFNVSGIQRTGQVVRLFAKGFKNERPLLETHASVNDTGFDSYTSYDELSGNYYIWLVQRGLFDYNIKLRFKDLDIDPGTSLTAETVNEHWYGQVTHFKEIPANKEVELVIPAQSVMLLTIPKRKAAQTNVSANAAVSVSPNSTIVSNNPEVKLDAANPQNNSVTYIQFAVPEQKIEQAQKVLLKVNGYTNKIHSPYRLHVYGFPNNNWNQRQLNWKNAPFLDDKEALIHEVGTKVFIAGEIAFTKEPMDHYLDVTEMVAKYAGSNMTFVLVRETRQLGDDEDKEYKVIIDSKKTNQPQLLFWNK